jgi:hypothetical protein
MGQTRTDVIAVLSPDNGDGTATVVTMTYSTAMKPGRVIADHGQGAVTVLRSPPAAGQWAAPFAVNCGQCGIGVLCAATADGARAAAADHIAVH